MILSMITPTLACIIASTLPVIAVSVSNNVIDITTTGAIGDGTTLNTVKIQSAIDQLAARGGGTLVIPKGVFLSGAIFLKPGVNLKLEEGAVLRGSTNAKDYPKSMTRIEGHFEEWLPALINADKVDHLRITGSGTLDGNGAPYWSEFWARLKADPATTNLNVERPRLALIQNSDDVQISGITFKDSAFWNLHLYRCTNVVVEKVLFEVPAGLQCPSTDGADVDSCQNVAIQGCTFRVDDDCIALKGSKGPSALEDKQSTPVEHIRISDCTFERGHGVVTLGSEATIVRDVVVENCKVVGQNNLVRLKLRPDTIQDYEDIHYRDITLEGNGAIIQIEPWSQYADPRNKPKEKSIVRNVTASNIRGTYGSLGVIRGNPGQTEISDITLENIDVQLKSGKLMAGEVKNLKIENITINGKPFSSKIGE